MPTSKVAAVMGNDISTDIIYPGRFMATVLPTETPQYAFADDAELNGKLTKKEIPPGSVIVAGKNFGCGSSREHAPIALKDAQVSCVIAPSFARIFYRNAFNMGLPIFESSEAAAGIREGDEVEVDADAGLIRNLTRGAEYHAAPIPPFMQELIADGGLMAHIAKKAGGRDA